MKDFELIYASQLRAKQRESRALVGGYEAMKKISKNYFKNRENM